MRRYTLEKKACMIQGTVIIGGVPVPMSKAQSEEEHGK
jgi:hypothetical protein